MSKYVSNPYVNKKSNNNRPASGLSEVSYDRNTDKSIIPTAYGPIV